MQNIPQVFIGVDVSKDTLDIHINPIGKAFKICNNEEAINKFIKTLNKSAIGGIGCEATGGYEILLRKLLRKELFNLWVIDPRRIKGFMISKSCRSKTDKVDAKHIAEFVSTNYQDYKIIEKPEEVELVQALVNRKNDLIKFRASEKARLKHPSHMLCQNSIEKVMKVIDEEIKALDLQIDKILAGNDELSMKIKRLTSIPGIGKSTAALLVSFVPELGKLSNAKISGLIGLCPYENESGKYKGKKFIKGGRAIPRKSLYMCALTAIKFDNVMKGLYDRLRKNKKPFKVAMVAVMHKMMIIGNSLLKRSEFYRTALA
jgi:transposase